MPVSECMLVPEPHRYAQLPKEDGHSELSSYFVPKDCISIRVSLQRSICQLQNGRLSFRTRNFGRSYI